MTRPAYELADDMAELLERAAVWFRGYESHHKAKGTHDSDVKAVTNRHRAEEIETMVARYRAVQNAGQPELPLPPVSDGKTSDMFGWTQETYRDMFDWMHEIDEAAMRRARK